MKCLSANVCLIAASVLLHASAVRADVFVIVNSGNALPSMSSDEINRVFLKKTRRFENGVNAEPIALTEGSTQRAKFNQKVLQRDEQQLKYYWSRKMFSGGDRPPPTVNSEAEVIAVVAEKNGGIGYLTSVPKDNRVKIVFTIKE